MATIQEIIRKQRVERNKCLQRIVESTADKKIIVSGPGTGKTYTFGELLNKNPTGNNLAMTFIRKLVAELETKLKSCAEVKTFHKYCKKILHKQFGEIQLIPYLTKIIECDSKLRGK